MISSANKWDSSNINLWFLSEQQRYNMMHGDNLLHSVGISLQQQTIRSQKPGSEPSKIVSTVFYWLVECQKKTQWKNSTPTFPFPFCLSSYIHQLDKISTCFMDIWTASPCLVSGVFALFVPLLRWLSSSHHISNGRVLAEKNMKRCRHCFGSGVQ